jgi:uncharacterized protein
MSVESSVPPRSWLQHLLVNSIRLYQRLLSPLSGCNCRFHPSCSHYAITAICKHGCVWGSGLTLWRLLRCNPLSDGGHDPVPEQLSLLSTK